MGILGCSTAEMKISLINQVNVLTIYIANIKKNLAVHQIGDNV